jgi:hypothetical protein
MTSMRRIRVLLANDVVLVKGRMRGRKLQALRDMTIRAVMDKMIQVMNDRPPQAARDTTRSQDVALLGKPLYLPPLQQGLLQAGEALSVFGGKIQSTPGRTVHDGQQHEVRVVVEN